MTKKEKQTFMEELEIKALDPKTITAYFSSLDKFFSFHKNKNKTAKQLCLPEIKEFQLHLVRKAYAPNTINRHLVAIRAFYRAVYNRTSYKDSVPRVKAPRMHPVILSREEVQKMISSVNKIFYKAILMTLYSTGMRSSELRNLKVTDIDSERKVITIKDGKGSKDRQALLSPVAYKYLREYWRQDRVDSKIKSDYVFMPKKNSHSGKAVQSLSHTALGYVVDVATKAAGIKKKLLHTLFATRLQFIF